MDNTCRRTWANIYLDNLLANYQQARILAPHSAVMAVVKADAYGCGAVRVAQTLQGAGCVYFAVATLDEALQLRENGITRPILILGFTHPYWVDELVRNDITQTVYSTDYAQALRESLALAGQQLKIHIKADTGMSRIGFRDDQEIAEVCRWKEFLTEGIFTHFATADTEDEQFTLTQFRGFVNTIANLEQKGIHFRYRHCCNSAALIKFPDMHMDMVREGIMLYGQTPSGISNQYFSLKPVMELKSTVELVKKIEPGESVSYGRHYIARETRTIATIAAGYGDGYARALGKLGGYVSINGQRAPILGSVCMDQMMVDVTDIEKVRTGQEVTLWGLSPTADELAARLGTISYEILCGVSKRVPRVYIQGGTECAQWNGIRRNQ